MKSHRIGAAFLFLAAFAMYLCGAYPSVSAGDSGEFITAGYVLGIPHAPGFPTYVILSKLLQLLLPFGNIGFRTNLFSSLCGAATVLLLYRIGLRLRFSPWVAGGAALLFMISTAHRVNAQASEVFALHALFTAAVLAAALSEQWVLTAFLAGLGLGNHQTVLCLGPALAWAYFQKSDIPKPAPLTVVLSLLGGLSVYGFLYVRAHNSSVLNLGNPDTLERLWRVITRADYGTLTLALGEAPARNASMTLAHLERFFVGLSQQISWMGLVLGVGGILVGIRQRLKSVLLLTGAFLVVGPGFFILGNLPFDAQSQGLLERFYIVPALCWVVLAAFGMQFLFERQKFLGLLGILGPLLFVAPDGVAGLTSFRHDLRAYAYGRNNLRSLPPSALFVMDGGDDTFYSLAYLRTAEKRRPDILLHDRGGVVFPGFYGPDFRALTRDEKEARRQQVERTALQGKQPLFYSTMNETILAGVTMQHAGMLYTPSRPGSQQPSLWSIYDLRGIAPWLEPSTLSISDYRTRALVPFYAYQRSVQAGQESDWENALNFSQSAFLAGPDVLWLIPNLRHNGYRWAQLLFQNNRIKEAERLCRLMTEWDPASSIAWSNRGAAEERAQHLEAAIESYQKAIQLNPASDAAWFNLSVAYWKKADWVHVIDALNRVLTINPNYPNAQLYLMQARARAGV